MNTDIATLAQKLISVMSAKNITISLAESCTGGLIAASVTDIPGASEIFLGSAVTYSNEAKRDLLGVEPRILSDFGAVSFQCAEKMAEGARHIFGSDISLSVTGIAGPEGGSAEKPVGTVWFGVSSDLGTSTFKEQFKGGRSQVRSEAVKIALLLLSEAAEMLPG